MRSRPLYPMLWLWVLFACGLARASDLALVGAKIYPSPTEQAIENGSILVHDGRILAFGPSAAIKVPPDATVIDCRGLVVTAGFWNSHVHILTPGLLHAEKLSSQQITSQLEEMLTRWGFTTVFDIASVLNNTTLIRRRIESGEVKGHRILTVGEPFWAQGGTPIYVRGFLEANHISIPEVESNVQAVVRVRQQILASLTTNPAQRFGYSTRRGRIAEGMDGDLVVLRADPAQDATAFSKVRYTILGGKIIHAEK
jgi:imidazolonepropionase-like amidohydrolase